jgi:hypothetical protein
VFEDNPTVSDRVLGLSAIGAVLLGGAVAVDLLVTGGFDFALPQAARAPASSPPRVQLVHADRYRHVSPRSYYAAETEPQAWSADPEPQARLAGEEAGAAQPIHNAPISEADLYAEIEALYAQTPRDAFAEAAQDYYEQEVQAADKAEPSETEVSASESGSPW